MMPPPDPHSLYAPKPRRQERRRDARVSLEEAMRQLPLCPLQSVLDAHAASLDAAHGKIRDADGELAELSAITTHTVARIVHLEKASREQEQSLAALKGGIEAIRTEQTGILRAIQSLADVSVSTHDTLIQHIDNTKLREAADHSDRLQSTEKHTSYLIKIAGMMTVITLTLVLIHGAVTGQPLTETLFGWISP